MSIDLDRTESKISDILSDITKQIASLASLLLFSSLIHEYFYFMSIGKEFLLIYSISDFAKSTVLWLPYAAMFGSLGFIVNFYDLNARFTAVAMYGEPGLEAWRKPDKSMYKLMKCVLIIIVLGLPFMTWYSLSIFQIPILIGLTTLLGRQISGGRLPLTNRPAEGIILYFFIAWLIVAAVFGGISEGITDSKREKPIYLLKLKTGIQNAVVLRSVEKGLIYKMSSGNRIIFSPWSEIEEISSPSKEFSNKQLIQVIIEYFQK